MTGVQTCALPIWMVLTFDAMHDEDWTERMRMGHEGQLAKLEAVIAGRAG